MRFFAYLLAIALAAPAPAFAALPDVDDANQAELDTSVKVNINEDLDEFFEQFQTNRKATQQKNIKRWKKNSDGVWEEFKPLVEKLQAMQQKRSDQFQIFDAQFKQKQFCKSGAAQGQVAEGEIDTTGLEQPESCLYTEAQLETIDDVIAAGRRGIGKNDNPRELVDNGYDASYEDNLYKMQRKKLTKAEVQTQGWSSDYWALASGATAKRYQLENGGEMDLDYWDIGHDWHAAARYYSYDPARPDSWRNYTTAIVGFFARHGANLEEFIALLSPAEKYDILVDDPNFTLTKAQLRTGEPYAFEDHVGGTKKQVETWMGICHGWAVAAYMDERPANTITVNSPSGRPVRFYPDDIKALSVLKWANGQTVRIENNRLTYGTKFIGGRCNKKESEDGIATNDDGVVTDEDCFDTNPGAWHISIVNQLGIVNPQAGNGNRTIVIDATFDYEVWNQPMVRYSYSYFNPQTKNRVRNIKKATVALDENLTFDGDDFGSDIRKRNYRGRAERPKYVVGVVMEAAYVVETHPQGKRTDSKEDDAVTTARYVYDLEIDENGKILGGEWYNNTHPDFLWTPTKDAFAYNNSDLEGLQQSWNWAKGDWTLPSAYAAQARSRDARKDATPLKVVVDGLIAKAKN